MAKSVKVGTIGKKYVSSDFLFYKPLIGNEIVTTGLSLRTPSSNRDIVASDLSQLEELGVLKKDATNEVVLNRHMVQTSAYVREAEGRLKWLQSLFSSKAGFEQLGVIQETKSFVVMPTADANSQIEWGVSIRLEVEATKFASEMQISVANIAAQAQVGSSQAQMKMSVRGYAGSLGDHLPAPKSLDFASYSEYLEKFSDIQKLVFGDAGKTLHAPVALGIFEPMPGEPLDPVTPRAS